MQQPGEVDKEIKTSRPLKSTKAKKSIPLAGVRINLTNCKYELLRIAATKLGWKEVSDDEEEWDVYWTDTSVTIDRVIRLQSTQKLNHFSGMLDLCRKKGLARCLAGMARLFPSQYAFAPRTYVLPDQLAELQTDLRGKKKRTIILKPDSGCQGKGITLVQSAESLTTALQMLNDPNLVASRYLQRPLLLAGLKFDLRVFVLVLSCDPLRVFIYDEGLVRFCTHKYEAPNESNLDINSMHLTNTAVNKFRPSLVGQSGETTAPHEGSKWSMTTFREWMERNGHDFEAVWDGVKDIIAKTLISVQPTLQHNYNVAFPPENDGFSCFEILGYDILLDHKCRPWLMEVNHSPSFTIDDMDVDIKTKLITDALRLVRVDPKRIRKLKVLERKASEQRLLAAPLSARKESTVQKSSREGAALERERYESKNLGNFSRVLPTRDPERQAVYDQLQTGAAEIFKQSRAARVHTTLSTMQDRRRKEEDDLALLSRATGLSRVPALPASAAVVKPALLSRSKLSSFRGPKNPVSGGNAAKLRSSDGTTETTSATASVDGCQPTCSEACGASNACSGFAEAGADASRCPSGGPLGKKPSLGEDTTWSDNMLGGSGGSVSRMSRSSSQGSAASGSLLGGPVREKGPRLRVLNYGQEDPILSAHPAWSPKDLSVASKLTSVLSQRLHSSPQGSWPQALAGERTKPLAPAGTPFGGLPLGGVRRASAPEPALTLARAPQRSAAQRWQKRLGLPPASRAGGQGNQASAIWRLDSGATAAAAVTVSEAALLVEPCVGQRVPLGVQMGPAFPARRGPAAARPQHGAPLCSLSAVGARDPVGDPALLAGRSFSDGGCAALS